MNDILWLLYFADLAKGLKDVVLVLMGFLIVASFFSFMRSSVENNPKYNRIAMLLGVSAFVIGLLSVFIPSKQYLYIVTGVEVTQRALDTEIGKKVEKLVNYKLDEVLKEFERKDK